MGTSELTAKRERKRFKSVIIIISFQAKNRDKYTFLKALFEEEEKHESKKNIILLSYLLKNKKLQINNLHSN